MIVVTEMNMNETRQEEWRIESIFHGNADDDNDEYNADVRSCLPDSEAPSIVKSGWILKRVVGSALTVLVLFSCGLTMGILLFRDKSSGTSNVNVTSKSDNKFESKDLPIDWQKTRDENDDTIDVATSGETSAMDTEQSIEAANMELEGILPTLGTTRSPTGSPTLLPTGSPSISPTAPTKSPTLTPTISISSNPSSAPTTISADAIRLSIPRPTDNSTANSVIIHTNSDLKYDYRANSPDFLVGVYYYPWHGNAFHNREGYMRKNLVPRQYPKLGEYNDSDPKIIREHMKMFRKGNIGLLVTSWWGPGRTEDTNVKDVIMRHQDIGNLKIALHYETFGRLGKMVEKIENARSDILYMCEHYFDHPNYYKVNGRPVVFLYLTRNLHSKGRLEQALLTMRSTANKCGHNLYIVGDHSFGKSTINNGDEPHLPFWYMDAVTNYDVYGSSGRPAGYAGMEAITKHYKQQSDWKDAASEENCRFIPSVSPGYNDRGVRLERDHPALSRRIDPDAEEGSLFYFQLKEAKKLVDENVDNLIMVNSFNEWHEDTQIEPVAVSESADWPPIMTEGLQYVGYGDLYLNILGASTLSRNHQGVFDLLYN